MKNSQLKNIKVQDTPIKSVRIEWREGNTDYSADLPISWILQTFGHPRVTDAKVNDAYKTKLFYAAVKKYAFDLIEKAHQDFPEQIASLTCSDDFIPKEFAI